MRQYRPSHTYVLSDFDTLLCIFRDLFDPVPHFFMMFVTFFHPSWADAAALHFFAFYSLGRCPQISATCRWGRCQRVLLSWNSLEISRTPPKFLEFPVLFVPHTRELLRRELEHVSRPGGVGCESSRTLAPSLFLFRSFLFGRAISVLSKRFFNRLRPKKKEKIFLTKTQ